MDISDTSDNPLKIFYVSSQSDKLRRKHAIWGKYPSFPPSFTSPLKLFYVLLKIFYVSSQSDKLRRKHAICAKYPRNNPDFTSVSKYFTSFSNLFTFALKVMT